MSEAQNRNTISIISSITVYWLNDTRGDHALFFTEEFELSGNIQKFESEPN